MSGTTLLEQAIGYAARSVLDVRPAHLNRRTPCADWNLEMLLRHSNESLAALRSGAVGGQIDLFPVATDDDRAPDLAGVFQNRASQLLATHSATGCPHQAIDIGELTLPAIAVDCAGAIEIAVHGWDISQACGRCRPIPNALAARLLVIAPLLVPEAGRYPLFGPRVEPAYRAGPTDRLVAFLGRTPPTAPLSADHPRSTLA